jgi:hypothetical protein
MHDDYDDDDFEFLPKRELMSKLEEVDNLLNAMGALFYASKRMSSQVPCCFEAWKDFAFESRASKIHELLSTGNQSLTSPAKSEIRSLEGTKAAISKDRSTISPHGVIASPDLFAENQRL